MTRDERGWEQRYIELEIFTIHRVKILETWIKEHVPNPFDHNGECIFCDEMGTHLPDCPWGNATCPHGKNVRKFGPCGWCRGDEKGRW